MKIITIEIVLHDSIDCKKFGIRNMVNAMESALKYFCWRHDIDRSTFGMSHSWEDRKTPAHPERDNEA
jgi:hypothetical protein